MRYRSGRWKRALPIAQARAMAEKAVLCVLELGETASLQPLDVEQAVALLTRAPEPGICGRERWWRGEFGLPAGARLDRIQHPPPQSGPTVPLPRSPDALSPQQSTCPSNSRNGMRKRYQVIGSLSDPDPLGASVCA